MNGSGDAPGGMLIGGADNGNVLIWNVDKIIRYVTMLVVGDMIVPYIVVAVRDRWCVKHHNMLVQ